jgi:hypothetical protein
VEKAAHSTQKLYPQKKRARFSLYLYLYLFFLYRERGQKIRIPKLSGTYEHANTRRASNVLHAHYISNT